MLGMFRRLSRSLAVSLIGTASAFSHEIAFSAAMPRPQPGMGK